MTRAGRRRPRRGRRRRRSCARTRWSTRREAAPARCRSRTGPAAASLSVPSPARTATASAPSLAARRGELGGVAPLVGLHDHEVVRGTESSFDLAARVLAVRGRGRVHDQGQAHGGEPYRPYDPGVARRTSRNSPRSPTRSSDVARARASSSGAKRSHGTSGPHSGTRRTGGDRCPGFGDPRASVLVAGLAPGGARREPHRARLHGRPLGRLAVRRDVPRRVREPAGVGRGRRRPRAPRRLRRGRGPVRAAGEQADDRGARPLPPVPHRASSRCWRRCG